MEPRLFKASFEDVKLSVLESHASMKGEKGLVKGQFFFCKRSLTNNCVKALLKGLLHRAKSAVGMLQPF